MFQLGKGLNFIYDLLPVESVNIENDINDNLRLNLTFRGRGNTSALRLKATPLLV